MKKLLLVAATFLLMGCGEKKEETEWKGPITEGLPDSVIAIETDGDTLTMRELEELVDSFNYYINLYSNEMTRTISADSVSDDDTYFYWEKEERMEEEWQEWEDSINSIAEQAKKLINQGIINE